MDGSITSLENAELVPGIYLDDFDSEVHMILLKKLAYYGIRRIVLRVALAIGNIMWRTMGYFRQNKGWNVVPNMDPHMVVWKSKVTSHGMYIYPANMWHVESNVHFCPRHGLRSSGAMLSTSIYRYMCRKYYILSYNIALIK